MSIQMHDDAAAPFKFHQVFISDTHLGSNKTSTPYLYEFLSNLDFSKLKKLSVVGDLIGGWEHQSLKQQPFPEMERRVLDIINYAANRGVEVEIIPGNHDEKLRPLIDILNKDQHHRETFPKNVTFKLSSEYRIEGAQPKRIKLVHGDKDDPELFVKWWAKPVVHAVSSAYDAMVAADYYLSRFAYKATGHHVSAAKKIKTGFKSALGIIYSNRAMLKGIEADGVDGILMGHTHMAGLKVLKNSKGRDTYLINDGDWQESADAAVVVDLGELPEILDYKKTRERLGFGDLPDDDDAYPQKFAELRWQTDRQIRLIHTLWPARNRPRLMQDFIHARDKLKTYRQAQTELRAHHAEFLSNPIASQDLRRQLRDIFAETKSTAYHKQKEGLETIFNRYAPEQMVNDEESRIFLRTVLRDLIERSERKIRKHEGNLQEVTDVLDLPRAEKPDYRQQFSTFIAK